MGVFGDRWTNNNELKSCSETKSDTTEPQPTRCRLQRDKKKTFAGRDKWLLQMRTLLHRNTDRFHLFILRASHESLFHKSCITHHPNCHPQEEGHVTEAPAFRENGIVWVSSLGSCGTEHINFKPCTIQ